MHSVETILLLLTVVVILAVFAKRLSISYPILLVLAGLGLGFIPNLPPVELAPNIVFLVFLPPILFYAAWHTSWKSFTDNLEPITMLAIGLVMVSTAAVAFAADYFIPEVTLAEGFLLGAIISPPDAVAATAITSGLGVPKRISTVLEGESLVNDAIGLVAFKFALATVMTGTFSASDALLQFFYMAIGGIAVGLAIGYVAVQIHKLVETEVTVEVIITVLTSYSSYILAEHLGLSGVLSAVAAGLIVGNNARFVHSSRVRIQAVAVWDFITFLINGLVFILIGLQLPSIMQAISTKSLSTLLVYGLLISAITIGVRFGYVHFVDFISKKVRARLGLPLLFDKIRDTTVIALTGMRGVVSLAAALSIPLFLPNGAAYDNRSLIMFLTFSVIFCTLVLQGLSLPLIIRGLGVATTKDLDHLEEFTARTLAAQESSKKVHQLTRKSKLDPDVIRQLNRKHVDRAVYYAGRINSTIENSEQLPRKIMLQAIDTERATIISLYANGQLTDDAFRRIEYDLDLEEARLRK